MINILGYGWIICFIIAYLIQTITSININNESEKSLGFLLAIAWILSIMGFIIFIVWLTRFNNTNILKYMWISSLITWIVSLGIVIFLSGNTSEDLLYFPGYLLGYAFTIFIGTLITFLVKNKN